MKALTIGLLICGFAAHPALSAQHQVRPHSNTQVVRSRELDSNSVNDRMNAALESLTKAAQLIDTTLPAYAGRRQHAKYTTLFAIDDLQAALKYHRPAPNGTPPQRPAKLNPNEKLKTIPKAAEKPRRAFLNSDMTNSDSNMNVAGGFLLEARDALKDLPDRQAGLLNEAKLFLNMAISDVERSIGRIKRPQKR